MFNFERLDVWQRTRKLVSGIYKISSHFPVRERFGLAQHICRSAVSILSNIAEGTSRFSKDDFKRFLELAIGSLYELVSQLFIARDNEYLTKDVFNNFYTECDVIAKMISKLATSREK